MREKLGGFPVVDAKLLIRLDPQRSSVAGLVGRHGNPVRIKQVLSPDDCPALARWSTSSNITRGIENSSSIAGRVWDAINGVSPEAFVIRTQDRMFLVDPVKADDQEISK